MKKEVIFAILLGLSLGLIVTYGTYIARKSFTQLGKSSTSASPSPTATASTNTTLTLASPEDESIQATKEVKVTGTTLPNILVVVFFQNDPQITRADHSGNFSLQGNLQSGANVITVRTIDDNGSITEEQRTVTFTTTPLEEAPTASASAAASASAKPKTTVKPTPKPSPTPTPKP
jgi:hypothetical protein